MKRIKYLTQAEVEKRAIYKLATVGSCDAPVKRVYGTTTTNAYGYKYHTADVSIMVYTEEFWLYWERRAKREGVLFELYADRQLNESGISEKE